TAWTPASRCRSWRSARSADRAAGRLLLLLFFLVGFEDGQDFVRNVRQAGSVVFDGLRVLGGDAAGPAHQQRVAPGGDVARDEILGSGVLEDLAGADRVAAVLEEGDQDVLQADGKLLHGGRVALLDPRDGLLETGDVFLQLVEIHGGLLERGRTGRYSSTGPIKGQRRGDRILQSHSQCPLWVASGRAPKAPKKLTRIVTSPRTGDKLCHFSHF